MTKYRENKEFILKTNNLYILYFILRDNSVDANTDK